MRENRALMTQIMKLSFQCLLYVFLFFSFFAILSITNPQMINLSRTAATTMATFAVIMTILTIVYGGYDLGVKKARSVFSSLVITVLISDIVTYFQLQIMNVNPANNEKLILFGEDLALLFGAMILQVGLIYFFVYLGYALYYQINPPQSCCLITSSQELADHVSAKIATFRRMYRLCDVVHYECPDVEDTIMRHDVVFLAGIPDTEEALLENFCYSRNHPMYLLAELEDVIISTAERVVFEDTPFLSIHRTEPTLVQRFVKRASDILLSAVGLVVFSPVMLITAVIVLCAHNGPVFFRQKRQTIAGKVFEIIKFRTMYVDRSEEDAPEFSVRENDRRVTPLGRVLRKYRIDELPQLWNVLRGEMSMVGPRPEMLENVDKYTQEVPEFLYRQQMKAGLTGLAQIDGKYNTSPKDKAILDLMYIQTFSLALDIKLMLRTLTIFFRRDSTEGFNERPKAGMRMRTDPIRTEPPKPAIVVEIIKEPKHPPVSVEEEGMRTAL